MEGVCMQIQAINNNVDFGKSKARKAREAAIRRQEDMILSLNDSQIQLLSTEMAKIQTNDKKHQNITNGLIASLPVIVGLQSAVGSRGMDGKTIARSLAEEAPKDITTKFFKNIGKNLKGPAARVAVGVASALSLVGLFAIVDGVVMAKRAATNNNEGARNFERKHPATTMIGTIGAALIGAHYIPKGISALSDKISAKNIGKMQRNLTKFGEKFNNNSFVKSMESGWNKMAQSTPSSLKSVGKYALALAPLMVVAGTLAHAFDHSAKKNRVAAQNFREVKDLQMDIINQRRINAQKANVAMANKLNARNA